MLTQTTSGTQYLHSGFKMIFRPGVRRFVFIPLSLNLVVYIALITYAIQQFNYWLGQMMPKLPSWLSFLDYLLWPLFVVLLLVVIFFTFTVIANLIASPFNSFLAEKVEIIYRGQDPFPAFSWLELVAIVPRSIMRELRKMAYYLPRVIGLLILSFVPVVNLVAAPLWVLFSVWMMAVQFIDYPADNNQVQWRDTLAWLRRHRWQSLGFGSLTYLALMMPLFNLLAMPAAIAGATMLWVDQTPLPPEKEINAQTQEKLEQEI